MMGIVQGAGVRYIAIFLFLLNFVMGLAFVNEGLFHYDSVVLAQAVEKTFHTGALQPAVRGRYGSVIASFLVSLPFLIFGLYSDFVINLSSILFHSLSIAVLFLFVRELFNDKRQAFYCALLFSLTPFYFIPNTYGKEHGASVFFLILSLLVLCRGVNKRSSFLIALSTLIFVFTITIRESVLVTVPLFFLLFFRPTIGIRPFKFVFYKDSLDAELLVSFILPLFAAASFILFVYLKDSIHNALFVNSTSSTSFIGLLSDNFFYALHTLRQAIPILIFILSVWGIFRMIVEHKLFPTLFLFFWFMLIFYIANTDTFVPRYLDIIIIPVYVSASYILSKLYIKNRIIISGVVAYFVISMFVFMYPMLSFRHQYNGEKRFALYVKEKTEDNAVVIALDGAPFISYYAKRKTISYDFNDSNKIDAFMKEVKEYLRKGIPVYLLGSALTSYPSKYFENVLYGNFNVAIAGIEVWEDYHSAEGQLYLRYQRLFKIELMHEPSLV